MNAAGARLGAGVSLLLVASLGLFMAVSAAAALPLIGLAVTSGPVLLADSRWAVIAGTATLLLLAFWTMAIGIESLADPQPGAVAWAAVRTMLLLGGLALLGGA
ncbi:hypothetical protein [Sphingomonas jatrophae]|uniref:Uncharacterized protein n=1 Tax=Sphingomonas jatrophae TaxID=1166337 RepID=A0A1I6M8W4_9SPHN|nr:hypothetical protein [Sphingomonas jatrophae]SFS12170.1 hypothetical protein SAMN05192580_3691 [Sphingomonas jatrophae]